MDFALTQEQQDLKELSARIMADLAPPESLPDFETGKITRRHEFHESVRIRSGGLNLPLAGNVP